MYPESGVYLTICNVAAKLAEDRVDEASIVNIDDRFPLTIVLPVYNDWESVNKLLAGIEEAFLQRPDRIRVLIVDDSSSDACPARFGAGLSRFDDITLLYLRRNLGHQRALAIGLSYLYDRCPPCDVVVMDGDGEDRPKDVPRLLDEMRSADEHCVVFAERGRRFEPLWFRIAYACYKSLHYWLTGIRVRVGNFSAMPYSVLKRVVVVSELWNHYAAAVFVARFPIRVIVAPRGERYAGESKMTPVSLLAHGLSAISVFGEQVGARLLAASGSILALSLVATLLFYLTTGFEPLGESDAAWLVVGILGLWLSLQVVLLAAGALLVILYSRDRYKFLPIRDYVWFVLDTDVIWSGGDKSE